eukprot:7933218-Karenia_brevis.AAC.1
MAIIGGAMHGKHGSSPTPPVFHCTWALLIQAVLLHCKNKGSLPKLMQQKTRLASSEQVLAFGSLRVSYMLYALQEVTSAACVCSFMVGIAKTLAQEGIKQAFQELDVWLVRDHEWVE